MIRTYCHLHLSSVLPLTAAGRGKSCLFVPQRLAYDYGAATSSAIVNRMRSIPRLRGEGFREQHARQIVDLPAARQMRQSRTAFAVGEIYYTTLSGAQNRLCLQAAAAKSFTC